MTKNPGGIESFIMSYYRYINKTYIQFDFLCNTESVAFEDEIQQLGGNIYRITARGKNYCQYKREIISFFEKNAKDYVAIWMNVCNLVNLDYLKYAKKYGIKNRIIHSHNSQNMDGKLYYVIHQMHKVTLPRYATYFWACSEDAGRWFYCSKIMRQSNFQIIKNAIEISKFKFNAGIREQYRKKMGLENKFVVGNIGRLHFQKNQLFLLDIFDKFKKLKPNALLLLVGQGADEDKIREKIKALHLDESVCLLGVRSDIPQLLQVMDAFVFPSVFEGLGIALLEAQAAGLPCFASKGVIPNEVKVIPEFQFIPLNDNPKEWAEYITDIPESESRSLAIEHFYNTDYDIVKAAKKLEKLFRSFERGNSI